MKYYISFEDWKKINLAFDGMRVPLFIYVDALSLDWKHKGEVGFDLLKDEFLQILTNKKINYIRK